MSRNLVSMLALATVVVGCKSENTLVDDNNGTDVITEPPPCIEVDPPTTDFGSLRAMVDAPKTELVTIKNTCEGDLEIYGLTLDDPMAPFTIGTLGAILVPPGASTDFTVTFEPLTSATWASKVLIDNNDPENPTAVAELIGEGVAPLIEVTPPTYDFGSPYIGCLLEQPINIANVGNADLVVDKLEFATGSIDFAFDRNGNAPPFTVTAGDSVDVFVNYQGLDIFEDKAYLTVESNDPWTPEVLVNAKGVALVYGDNADVFEQPLKKSADILFVVDNSCSMAEEQASLADNFEVFVDTIVAADGDFQLAVITTDNPKFRGDIIDGTTVDPVGDFSTMALAGTSGSGDEKGLEMAYQATGSSGDGGPGSDFLRDRSTLSIVILSDEEDASTKTVADYYDYFLSIKSDDPDQVRIHAIAGEVPTPSCTSAYAAKRYDEAVTMSGGEFVSICASDWGASLEAVALGSLTIHDSFELSEAPVPATIKVKVDGINTTVGWTYNASNNMVEFASDYVPAGGSTIEIDYALMPDCDG